MTTHITHETNAHKTNAHEELSPSNPHTLTIGLLVSLKRGEVEQIAERSGIIVRSFMPVQDDENARTPRAVSSVQLDVNDLAHCDIIFGWHPHLAQAVAMPSSQIRWIQLFSAGADYVPLDCMRHNNIIVTTASGANAPNIAQQVLAYMLMFERRLHLHVREAQLGLWTQWGGWGELTGKTVCILGTGEIGTETARLCHAMSMTTIGVNRSGHSSENFDSCLDLTHMREAIAQADYVVNALPLTADTADCVNAQVFQAMKSSAYYINVGRGKTTVSRDLVSAIQSGNIAGAALDVFDTEPLPHSDILWTLPNVICTPHTAGYSDMYTQRVLNSFLDNLNSFACDGQPKKHILNLNAGY